MNRQNVGNLDADIKRVGKSGQISLGKEHVGQYFREERRSDGSIVLIPVVVLARSHWSVRDEGKIRQAIAWAAENRAKQSDVDDLLAKVDKAGPGKKRGK